MRKILLTVAILVFLSCAATSPPSFVRIMEPTWSSIELRPDVSPDEAWEQVVDILAKRFELEMISREGKYIRTSWMHTWWKLGELTENYRVRTVVKFSPDQKRIDVKTEAQYLERQGWIIGTDTRLLKTVKMDIMGVVGRTTK